MCNVQWAMYMYTYNIYMYTVQEYSETVWRKKRQTRDFLFTPDTENSMWDCVGLAVSDMWLIRLAVPTDCL